MNKIIDILGIILPAFIILLGIARLFVKKSKGFNGLIMFSAILLLIIGLMQYLVFTENSIAGKKGEKMKPLTVSKHGEVFNQSIENILIAYYNLTTDFSKADPGKISQSGNRLKLALDSFNIEDLQKDSLIYQTAMQPYENAKAELQSIIEDPDIAEKRGSLNIFSNELFSLLTIVRYDRAKLYWQQCDEAFGEGRPGNWLSPEEKSINPYGQSGCADIKTSINFVPADSTNSQ